MLLKHLFFWLLSIELLSILLGAWLKQIQFPKHCLCKTPQPTIFGTFVTWFLNGWDACDGRRCHIWSRTANDISFSVEAFGDHTERQYLSNEHFDVTVDTLYFCRLGISVDCNLLSRSYFCLTKMRNSLFLKMGIFVQDYLRSNKTACSPRVLQVSVWEAFAAVSLHKIRKNFACRDER
jgi:hypothetical protein